MNAEYYKLLNEFLAFTTTHIDNNSQKESEKCSQWIESLFVENGFKVDKINNKNPIIIASYNIPDGQQYETGLIYGNYDVQTADIKQGWKDTPFSLYFGKDKIFGRGVASGKSTLLIYMLSIFKLIKENKLQYNVIFLIDGENLIGSQGLQNYLKNNQIKADFLISSIGTIAQNNIIINNSFRGGFTVNLSVKSATKDGLIGQYGGIIANPIDELSRLFSKLYDINNQITIPYFYYDVEESSTNEKIINNRIPFEKDAILQEFDTQKIKIANTDYFSKIGHAPCIEITNINSGTKLYNENIPNIAQATINIKLVANQKTSAIKGLFKEWLANNLPNYIKYDTEFINESEAIKINLQNYFSDKAQNILLGIYKNKVYQTPSGFSFSIAKYIYENITKNIINIPLVNGDSNINGINENIDIDLVEKGFLFAYEFFKK